MIAHSSNASRRISLALALCTFMAGVSTAQLVYIPDQDLRDWYNTQVPGCVDVDGYLNSADPGLQNITTAYFNVDGTFTEITGLEYLTGLVELWVYAETPSCVPFTLAAWPPNLETLFVDSCALASIPAWPASLTALRVYDENTGGTEQLPYALPTGLIELEINGNDNLQTLPALPAGLEGLTLESCSGLTDLGPLPAGLQRAYVSYATSLLGLPQLPGAMNELQVFQCPALSSMGTLPATLTILTLSGLPALTDVPACPEGVTTLNVDDVILDSWGAFPDAMVSLGLGQDWFAAFNNGDPYPGLCFPTLPENVYSIYVVTSPIVPTVEMCLPNHPPGLISADVRIGFEFNFEDILASIPVCVIPEPDCPLLGTMTKGITFTDLNGDGVKDGGEPLRPGVVVGVEPGGILTLSDVAAEYQVSTGVGTYAVQGVPPLYHTITTAAQVTDLLVIGEVDSLNAIGYQAIPDMYDLVVDLTCWPSRPGFETQCWGSVHNVGTAAEGGELTLTIDGDQSWMSSAMAPTSVVGNEVQWTIPVLQPGEVWSSQVTLYTDAAVALGTALEHVIAVAGTEADQTEANNTYAYQEEVVGSFDPNDKRVEPELMTPEEVLAGEPLTYTIRFQNTGTYPAERVVITDTLSEDLQWGTMHVMSSSHQHTWYIENGVLHVVFEDINLPDSTSDELGSHGFVRFSMLPSSDLVDGSQVLNAANIYFDYNPPVITNTAMFTVDANVGVAEREGGALRVYPNPANDRIAVDIGADSGVLQVIDALGRLVIERSAAGSGHVVLPVGCLAPGTYSLRVLTGQGVLTTRFMKR